MIPIWHTDHVAFYALKALTVGDIVEADKFVKPNGLTPIKGDRITCGFCREEFDWQAAMKAAFGHD